MNRFFTESVFGVADPSYNNPAGLTVVEAFDMAASKIDSRFPDNPALRAVIHERFGEIYSGLYVPQKAVEQLLKAVELRRALAGDHASETLKSRSSLGFALFQAGRWYEAQDMLESVWADQKRLFGNGSPEATETACSLAVVCQEIRGGAWAWPAIPPLDDRDLEVARTAYDAALSKLGPRHPATLRIENTLGWALRWRDRSREGIHYAEEAAAGLRQVKGADDLDTLFARYNYAFCLFDLGQFDEASDELLDIYAIRKRVLGRTHFHTLCTAWQLARALAASGKQGQALEVVAEVHADLPEIKSLKTLLRASKVADFCDICRDFKEYSLAKDFLTAADEMAAEIPDDEVQHSHYARQLNVLANQMLSFPDATHLNDARRATELATKACELSDYKNATFVRTLVSAYSALGDDTAAASAREKLKAMEAETATSNDEQPKTID